MTAPKPQRHCGAAYWHVVRVSVVFSVCLPAWIQADERSRAATMKRAGFLLLGGWVAMFTYVTLLFTFPHAMTPIADWFGPYFTLVPAFLFLASLVFVLALLLSIGMRKSK
jgi:hypothetical protein